MENPGAYETIPKREHDKPSSGKLIENKSKQYSIRLIHSRTTMLTYQKFLPGARIIPESYVIAQDKMHVATDGNMDIWYFTYPELILVFWMDSNKRGSGKLLENIREIEGRYRRPVWIADPLFARLFRFCERNGIPCCSPKPEVSIRRPQKPAARQLKPYDGKGMLPAGALEYFDLYNEQMMFTPDSPGGQTFEMRMTPKMKDAIKNFYPLWEQRGKSLPTFS